VTALPPSLAGAVQLSATTVLPATPLTPLGAPAGVAGVTGVDGGTTGGVMAAGGVAGGAGISGGSATGAVAAGVARGGVTDVVLPPAGAIGAPIARVLVAVCGDALDWDVAESLPLPGAVGLAGPAGEVVEVVEVPECVVVDRDLAETSLVAADRAGRTGEWWTPTADATAKPATTTVPPNALPAVAARCSNRGRPLTMSPKAANGPPSSRMRPIDASRNTRTMAGSKWVPAHAASSVRAASAVIADLYARTAVIVS